MRVGSGGGVKSVGVKGAEKIGRLCLVFAALVASATATPDWSKGQKSSLEQSRALTT